MSCQICSVKPVYLLLGLLVLSGFTHLWNAVGFPDVFFDEGVYMRRAMHVLEGLGPQEAYFHDHPFFGQIILASYLALIGFPNSFHPSASVNSIASLYLAPRIFMGILAIVDTFLIYKIAENRYGTKIALISSMFFAVMPITWLVRRILLDSILIPFLLMSILFVLYSKNSRHKNSLVLLSGICMGIAIFTKIPVFAMAPMIAGLIYFYNEKSLKLVALWIIPVILIPMLWPLQSVEAGQFNLWVGDVLSQTQRHSAGLSYMLYAFFDMDPLLFVLGSAGIAFCIFKRDYFVLMWVVPFLLFLLAIGYNQYFYCIPLLPVICISASVLIVRILGYIKRDKLKKTLPYVIVLGIGTFGLVSTLMIITTNMTSSEFQTAAFVLQHIPESDNKTTILASPTYSWIFNSVFHRQNVFLDYSLVLWQQITTPKVLLVVDPHYMIDIGRGNLSELNNDSKLITSFDGNVQKYNIALYPYTNLKVNYEGSHIAIKEK
ncbi:MAG TPA: glycosyltransferase family 39 protein [Candidatus Nitrosotalea sp.]|nr:glycosyltransferase family 39 protein [Candidatus Nitrosotalea sp.]